MKTMFLFKMNWILDNFFTSLSFIILTEAVSPSVIVNVLSLPKSTSLNSISAGCPTWIRKYRVFVAWTWLLTDIKFRLRKNYEKWNSLYLKCYLCLITTDFFYFVDKTVPSTIVTRGNAGYFNVAIIRSPSQSYSWVYHAYSFRRVLLYGTLKWIKNYRYKNI